MVLETCAPVEIIAL